jgi:hypothetical protein
MGTFSNAQAVYGLSATGTPATTSTNVSGSVLIGVSPTVVSITSPLWAASFKAVAATTNATFSFEPSSLSTTLITTYNGVTFYDADALDWEGRGFTGVPAEYHMFAAVSATTAGSGPEMSSDNGESFRFATPAGKVLMTPFSGFPDAWSVTLPFTADYIEITIVAK